MRSEYITVMQANRPLQVSVNQRIAAKSGHLVLFLHGLGCAKESFDGAFTAPGLEPYSLCAMDFVGFGESDKPDDFTYKLEDQAKLARQVVEAINPRRLSIVAHSMGGAVGLLLARQLPPNLLQTFVSVEGNLVTQDCGLVSRRTAEQSLSDYEDHGFAEFLQLLESSDRQDFHEWATWYKQASPKAIHASAQSMVAWSDSGQLLDIFNGLPNKTYMYGDEEPKDYLLPQLKNTDLRYLPGLNHFMMVQDPQTFYDAVAESLPKP